MNQDTFPIRFLQNNRDRRQIYAVVDRGGVGYGYGPLPLEQVDASLFGGPYRPSRVGPGDPALAASLAARADEFHDLEDFFRFYGYPPDVVDWVEATDLRGVTGTSKLPGSRRAAGTSPRWSSGWASTSTDALAGQPDGDRRSERVRPRGQPAVLPAVLAQLGDRRPVRVAGDQPAQLPLQGLAGLPQLTGDRGQSARS